MSTRARLASLALLLASTTLWVTRTVDARQDPFLGRWSLTSTGDQPVYVGWLEVSREAGQLTARFSNRGGSPTPVASVQILNGELVFQPAAGRRGPSAEHRARVQGEKLIGSTTSGDRTIEFVGVRPPKWPAADASAPHKFGPPIELFDGKSMDAWDLVRPEQPCFLLKRPREPPNRAGAALLQGPVMVDNLRLFKKRSRDFLCAVPAYSRARWLPPFLQGRT